MKSLKLALLILLCSTIPAWAQEKSHVDLVNELIVKSGLQRQLEQIPEVMKTSFEQRARQDNKMTAEERYNVKNVIVESYDPVKLIDFAKKDISAGLTDEQITKVLSWLSSPLGQKITQLEEQSSSAKAYREMQEFAQGLQANPPSEDRMRTISALDQAARMTECVSEMKIAVALAMGHSMSCAAGCPDSARDEITQQLEKLRPQILMASEQETMVSSLYTYQLLSDEELKQYIGFYETSEGQKYSKVISESLIGSISDASKNAGEKLGALIKEKKQQAQEQAPAASPTP